MIAKIPLNKIAELTARSSSEEVAPTLQFIKDLFSIVEDEVAQGNEVKIPGLGVFVKSGIIDEPISFIPEDDFAAQLNEAFSMFSPVELNEEVSEAELDTVSELFEDSDTQTESVKEPEAIPAFTVNSETQSVPEKEKESIKTSIDNSDNDVAIEANPITEELVDTEIHETEPTVVELPRIEEITERTPLEAETVTEIDDIQASPEVEADMVNTPEVHMDEDSMIPEEDIEYVVVRKSKSRFWIGLFLGIIIGFALGVIAFLAYIVQILQVQVEDVFPF